MPYLHKGTAGTTGVILGAAFFCVFAPLKAAEAKPAAKARPMKAPPGRAMSASELRQIYSGKTWVWPAGGGYMAPSGSFVGVTGKGTARASYVRGAWQVGGKGRMCFGGVWTVGSKRMRGQTCFSHREAGGTIYQRKEPSGAWYVFKHSPARRGDEFRKLVSGNRVST